MIEPVALLRADGPPLVVDGAITVAEHYEGDVTTDPLPDRTYVTKGITVGPTRASIRAIVSPNPAVEGLTTGVARLQEVRNWLQDAKLNGVLLDVQRPGRSLLVDFVVQKYNYLMSNSDGEEVQIDLVEVRIASAESITLEARRAPPVPRPEAKDGLETETDKGVISTRPKSFFADALDYLTGAE